MIGAVRGAPYLSHFALREPPFASSAGPRFFFADPARQQCLDMLHHLAEYSEEWLLVSGAAGIGKTTLLDEFIRRANPHLRPCRVDGTVTTDGAQLFLHIAGAFGLDLARHKDGDPLEQLRTHLNALSAEQVPLVAVDDADRLGDDALEIVLHLANLEGKHGRLVRVVLFADESLRVRLQGPRFATLPQPHGLELRPLDEPDTARYLVHRMSVAGYEGVNPFDAAVVKRMFKETGGLPGPINRNADQFLRQRMGEEKGTVRRPWGRRALVPVAAAAAITGTLVALHTLLNGSPEQTSTPPMRAETRTRPVPPPSPPADALATREAPGEAATEPAAGPLIPEADPPEVPVAAAETTTPPETTPTAAPSREPPTPSPEPAKPVTRVRAKPLNGLPWLLAQEPGRYTLQLLAAGKQESVTGFLKGHPPETPFAVIETTRDGAPVYLVVAGSYDTHAEATVAATRFSTIGAWPRLIRELPLVREPAKDPEGLKSGQWIATREPNRYTLQLVAAEHRQIVLNQLGTDRLPGPTALFATERHGKPLYMAVYGDYPDEGSAQKAFQALPARLRQGSPLVRDFGTLQEGLPPKASMAPQAN